MNQKGFAELGAILVLLAIGAAMGIVNTPHKTKTVEVVKVVEVEKPVVVEVEKIIVKDCEKKWFQIWK